MARKDSLLVSRTLYQLGMVTLVTAVVWVVVGVYLAISKPLSVNVDKSLLAPITPTIDQQVISDLSKRLKVEIDLTSIPEASESATR